MEISVVKIQPTKVPSVDRNAQGGRNPLPPPRAVEKQLSQAPNVTFVVEEAPAQDESSRCPEEILFEQCKELSINRGWNAESGEAKDHLAR